MAFKKLVSCLLAAGVVLWGPGASAAVSVPARALRAPVSGASPVPSAPLPVLPAATLRAPRLSLAPAAAVAAAPAAIPAAAPKVRAPLAAAAVKALRANPAVKALSRRGAAVGVSQGVRAQSSLYDGRMIAAPGAAAPVAASAGRIASSGLRRAAEPGKGSPSRLGRAAPAGPAEPRAGFWSRIPLWAKIVVPAVVVIGTFVGIYYYRASERAREWANSPQASQMALVEKARAERDAEALDRLGDEARASRAGRNLQDALGRRHAAYDGAVAARADLNENAVSQDPALRIGETPPAAWRRTLTDENAAAAAGGHEGRLALGLQALKAELDRQDFEAKRLSRDIEEFADHTPNLFADRMREQVAKARAELKEFSGGEVSGELALYNGLTRAMRDRVTDRLAGADAVFREAQARSARLSLVLSGELIGSLDAAQRADEHLADASRHRRDWRDLTKRAEEERDPEQAKRLREQASAARDGYLAGVAKAEALLEVLDDRFVALHGDAALRAEGLQHPIVANIEIGRRLFSGRQSWLRPDDLYLPDHPTVDDLQDARLALSPILSALKQVKASAESEAARVREQIDARVDEEIRLDMREAGG